MNHTTIGPLVVSTSSVILDNKITDQLQNMYENNALYQEIGDYSQADFLVELSACTDCETSLPSDSLLTCSSCGSLICSNCLSPHFEFQCYSCFTAQFTK